MVGNQCHEKGGRMKKCKRRIGWEEEEVKNLKCLFV